MTLSRRMVLTAATLIFAGLPRLGHAGASRDWLTRWLAAFNAADASAYPDFVRAHIPTLIPYLDDDLALREASGGFTLLHREETGQGEITAWLRDRNWDRFSKVVLSVSDQRIEDLSFQGAPPPADYKVERLDEGVTLALLRTKLQEEAVAGRFSGAVMVARGGKVLFREAYGTMDAEKTAVRPDTRFCIGSMGKMFTAVAVLQLAQQGRLHLTDTVATLLPAYPDTPLARQVTVRHLLSHTGGTGDFFGPDYEAHADELQTPADFIPLFGGRETAFPPGSRWGYSNFGYILLGAIIERVSGLDWAAYQQRHVFQPAGMVATSPLAGFVDTATPLTGAMQTGLKPLAFYKGLPAGGGYSTLDDLHRFGQALTGGTLLDPPHLDLLTQGVVQAGSAQWAMGLRVARRNGVFWYGHGGSAPGVNGEFACYPASRYRVTVLANRGHPHAANVAEFIGSRLPPT